MALLPQGLRLRPRVFRGTRAWVLTQRRGGKGEQDRASAWPPATLRQAELSRPCHAEGSRTGSSLAPLRLLLLCQAQSQAWTEAWTQTHPSFCPSLALAGVRAAVEQARARDPVVARLLQNQLCLWKYPSMVKMAELTGHTARVLHMAQVRPALQHPLLQ